MKTHFGLNKAQRQAEYCAAFSDALLARFPRLSGRIDWEAVTHYFFSGVPVANAIEQYVIARNIA